MSSNQISPRVAVVEAAGDLVKAARMFHHQVEPRLTSRNNMKKKQRRRRSAPAEPWAQVHAG